MTVTPTSRSAISPSSPASSATDAMIRDMSAKDRDAVAAKMTPAQITEAQRLAQEWKPK
jgi:hypothetical protein